MINDTNNLPISVRHRAIQVLVDIFEYQKKYDMVIEKRAIGLDTRDKAFLHELVLGVLRRFFSLEADFSRFLKQKPDTEARMCLFIGTYQLRHMRIPSHAAVSECVDAIKYFQPKAAGMVNAVLRKITQHDAPKKLKPHQRAELPQWMYALWRDAWGAEITQDFCNHLQHQADLSLAVFEHRETWIQKSQQQGLSPETGELSPYAVLLPTGTCVPSLPEFDDGAFQVMDQAAQDAVMALDVSQDGLILDICSAPGGKAALLAHRFPTSHIMAVELNAKRLPRLQANLKRLQINHVTVLQANACHLPIPNESVDAIMLDAPCSASGILRRHPDAKFLHHQQHISTLAQHQKDMLQEAFRVLKVGGTLIYAVCSIHPQENEQVIEGFNIVEQKRLYPSLHHDGFFWAKIVK
ncbi:MAG: transcription antitermination factor NusB [Mariprofundaceae bacterium]|nr:transcription antitermination factor NusB [Mariprofundaceae bacterium]